MRERQPDAAELDKPRVARIQNATGDAEVRDRVSVK
jgi:hypothetical protein